MGDEQMEEMLKATPQDEFEAWLNGDLPAKYYDYPLKGLEKDSTKWKAKRAYLDKAKKRKEMSEFNEVKKKVKSTVKRKRKKSDTFLSKYNGTKKEGDKKND